MLMGRPREHNKDLPPFLHRRGEAYCFYGPPVVDGKRTFHTFKATTRAAAIDEYWRYRKQHDEAEAGTFGEIIDAYLTNPYGLARVPSAETRYGYERMAPTLRKLWGAKR